MRAYRILVVEDNPDQASTLRRLLTKGDRALSFEVFIATSLAEALVKSQELKADITLLDLNLPDTKDWHETAAAIKSFFPPVIVVTAMPPDEVRVECMAQGAQEVFDKKDVLKAIEVLIGPMTSAILREIAPKLWAAQKQEHGS